MIVVAAGGTRHPTSLEDRPGQIERQLLSGSTDHCRPRTVIRGPEVAATERSIERLAFWASDRSFVRRQPGLDAGRNEATHRPCPPSRLGTYCRGSQSTGLSLSLNRISRRSKRHHGPALGAGRATGGTDLPVNCFRQEQRHGVSSERRHMVARVSGRLGPVLCPSGRCVQLDLRRLRGGSGLPTVLRIRRPDRCWSPVSLRPKMDLEANALGRDCATTAGRQTPSQEAALIPKNTLFQSTDFNTEQ